MGNLLCYFSSSTEPLNIFLDLENARPKTSEEEQVYEKTAKVLESCSKILERFRQLETCENFIRQAISKPSQESEKNAWVSVLPIVDELSSFYDFSTELANIIPLLLSRLCSTGGEDASDRLVSQQALAKQFGDIINFVLAFDEIKFEKAKIQNDFSYYRRVVSRKRTEIDPNDLRISDQKADQLSLFFAYATPMMKCVIDCLVQFKTKNEIPEHDIYETLATMSNVFYSLIETKKFENQETNIFCLRGMTGCIILYDHVHPVGSFRKKSPIMIKQCLTLLLEYQPKQQGLINAIKFSTKHLKDETTQAQVKQLLDV